ncbi:MAG: hypothetical protein V4524_00735 [Patescibacteria group bacterium]
MIVIGALLVFSFIGKAARRDRTQKPIVWNIPTQPPFQQPAKPSENLLDVPRTEKKLETPTERRARYRTAFLQKKKKESDKRSVKATIARRQLGMESILNPPAQTEPPSPPPASARRWRRGQKGFSCPPACRETSEEPPGAPHYAETSSRREICPTKPPLEST